MYVKVQNKGSKAHWYQEEGCVDIVAQKDHITPEDKAAQLCFYLDDIVL